VLRVGEECIPFLGEADIKEVHEKFVGGDAPANDKKPKLLHPDATTPASSLIPPASASFPMPPPASGVFAAPPSVAPVHTAASTPGRSTPAVQHAPHAWPESSIQKVVRIISRHHSRQVCVSFCLQLLDLGFSRDAAIRALTATAGNVEYAAGMLF
jgi:hypothetical protein